MFKCSHCDRSDSMAQSLHEHRKAHSLPIHYETFEKRISLNTHVKQSHGNELKSNQCDFCSDSFSLCSSLSLYMEQKHKGPQYFQFVTCGKV